MKQKSHVPVTTNQIYVNVDMVQQKHRFFSSVIFLMSSEGFPKVFLLFSPIADLRYPHWAPWQALLALNATSHHPDGDANGKPRSGPGKLQGCGSQERGSPRGVCYPIARNSEDR